MSTGGSHGVIEDGAHWHAHHANILSCIGPLGCAGEDVVQDCKHVAVVTYLLVACWIFCVWGLVRYLIPHLSEEHANARV